ncbi:MAG: hypothetical protein LKJ25_04985 [Clostridia bacterium]|nr:hypothetical protein [Clostridia bacterium]
MDKVYVCLSNYYTGNHLKSAYLCLIDTLTCLIGGRIPVEENFTGVFLVWAKPDTPLAFTYLCGMN